MLSPFVGKRRKLRFATYDLEWVPHNYHERLVGVYEPDRGYRCYPTTLEFLRNELTYSNRGKVYFAHAGGLADAQFILDEIIKRGNKHFEVGAHFSGSSAVIVGVTSGRNKWTFVDSFWLLRDSLARIGASLGLEKGGADYFCSNYPACGHEHFTKPTCIFYAPMGLLRDYNALDCKILHTAIQRFEDEVWALGGQLKLTVASTALMLFRAQFLKRKIETSDHLNRIARDAYVASRVEVIQKQCGPADYFDINSSFPWSMTKPQPGRILGTDKRFVEGDLMAMVDATVSIPVMHIPPAPMRVDSRVYFPTGTFRRWFMGEDLKLILETGGRIEKVHEATHFEPFDDMGGYVESIYEMRRKSTDNFQRIVYKYLLNSLYGKFGESSEKTGLLINPKQKPQCQGYDECKPVCTCKQMYRAGVWKVRKEVRVKHAHVPISANITASSRALITKFLQSGSENEDEVYYCDTDSIVTTKKSLPTGDKLGELKHEKSVTKGTFLAAKLYRTFPGPEIKAKGFRKLDNFEFESLANGDAVTIERMVRVRENFSKGHFSPREDIYVKRTVSHLSAEELRERDISEGLALRPKRAPEKGGKTRPWDYRELNDDSKNR